MQIKKILKEYWPIILMMALVAALSVDSFFGKANFDSGEYYDRLVKITWSNFYKLETLKLCNHITIAYAFIVFVLANIVQDINIAAILLNVICLVASTPIVYKLVKRICPGCSNLFAYLCTAIFVFSPFTFGSTGYIYPQTFMFYSTLFFIYAYLKKNKPLMFVFALLIMFSFETGVFITAALIFIPCIIAVFKSPKKWEGIKSQITVFNICALLAHVAFVVVFFLGNWATNAVSPETQHLKFGFDPIILPAIFGVNFLWVSLIIIVLALIKAKGFKDFKANRELFPFYGVFLTIVLVSTFAVTFHAPRYYYIATMSVYFCAFYAVHSLMANLKWKMLYKIAPFCVAMVLLVVQCYYTIDPVMLCNPKKLYTGNPNYITQTKDYRLRNSAAYNKQLRQFDIAFENVLKKSGYDDETCYISNYDICGGARGNGGSRSVIQRQHIKVYEVASLQELAQITEAGEHTHYWYLDYHTGRGATIKGFEALEVHTINYLGWKITVSKIAL